MTYWENTGRYQKQWDTLRNIVFDRYNRDGYELRGEYLAPGDLSDLPPQAALVCSIGKLLAQNQRGQQYFYDDGEEYSDYMEYLGHLEDYLVLAGEDSSGLAMNGPTWDASVNEEIKKDLARIHLGGEIGGPHLAYIEVMDYLSVKRSPMMEAIYALIAAEDNDGEDCYDRIINRVVEYCRANLRHTQDGEEFDVSVAFGG